LLLIYAFYVKDFGVQRWWFNYYAILSALIVVLALSQAIYWQLPIIIPALGVRSYVFYIPLAFIMADVLTHRQMGRILRFLLWVSIPVGILVLVQFLSPVAHPINKGTSDDVAKRFTVVQDIIRPYGPFTFTAAQAHFGAMMLAILAICVDGRRKYEISIFLLLISGFSILTMGALSGGRTYFGFAILVVTACIFSGFSVSRVVDGAKRIFLVFCGVGVFLTVFIFVFPRSFAAMTERQLAAQSVEGSTVGRVLNGFYEIVDPFFYAPLFGYGVGAGSNAGRSIMGTADAFTLGETEWARMVNELGPIIGYPVFGLRVLLVVWLMRVAFSANQRTSDGSALILFGFSGYLLLAGQVTLQNQLLAICWFSVGLLMAFARLARTPQ